MSQMERETERDRERREETRVHFPIKLPEQPQTAQVHPQDQPARGTQRMHRHYSQAITNTTTTHSWVWRPGACQLPGPFSPTGGIRHRPTPAISPATATKLSPMLSPLTPLLYFSPNFLTPTRPLYVPSPFQLHTTLPVFSYITLRCYLLQPLPICSLPNTPSN